MKSDGCSWRTLTGRDAAAGSFIVGASKLYNLAVAALLTTILFAACVTAGAGDAIGDMAKRSAVAGKAASSQGAAIEAGSKEVAAGLQAQETTARGVGRGIQDDVNAGRQATPADGAAALQPIWDSLWGRAQSVLDVAGALTTLTAKVNEQTSQVHTLNIAVGDLVAANAGLAAAAKNAQAEADAARKAAEAATTQAAHITALVVALAIAAAGIGVFFSLMLKDVKIGIAGVGGAVTIIILASFLGEIGPAMHTLVHVAAIVGGVCGVLFIGEVIWRKLKEGRTWTDAMATALKTNPLQDIHDILADLQGAAAPPGAAK